MSTWQSPRMALVGRTEPDERAALPDNPRKAKAPAKRVRTSGLSGSPSIAWRDGVRWRLARIVVSHLDDRCQRLLVCPRIDHVPHEWKRATSVVAPHGTRRVLALTEAGLNFFLSRSDKECARPLQMWIDGEVLPKFGPPCRKSCMPPPPTFATFCLGCAPVHGLCTPPGRDGPMGSLNRGPRLASATKPNPVSGWGKSRN